MEGSPPARHNGVGFRRGPRGRTSIPTTSATIPAAGLRLAAAFLAAAAIAAVPACAARPPGTGGAPAKTGARARWSPRLPVARAKPLPEDPDLKAPKGDFTGSDSCVECHKGRVKSLSTSFHANLVLPNSGSVGCEECHGPGLDHVGYGDGRGIRDPRKAAREAGNAVCLRCHASVLEIAPPSGGHPLWVKERRIACVSCHEVHFDREERTAAHGRGPFADAKALEDAGAVFVEPARCFQCHPDYHPEMAKSGHADLATDGKACATCHGNGSLHVASGGLRGLILEPTKQDPALADASCVACHDGSLKPPLRWTCSEHRAENVACVACHDPNARRGDTLLAKDPDLCLQCHQDTGAEFRRPSRHRVLEGAMKCNDCHDPHANESGFHRFELTRTVCAKCHPEKAGPFVFEHMAGNLEGCIACHRPHGSHGPRLMDSREVRMNCLQCHPDLPVSHEQKPGSKYRDCLRCHIEIHGSDVDRRYFR